VTAACGALALLLVPSPLSAHPHVWIKVQTTVLYENGAITGLRHRWEFDELYAQAALEGLDVNGDGVYDRQELDGLAEENVEGLKDFNYFTTVKLGEVALALKEPVDYFVEHKDNVLSLHLTLPLAAPVLAEAPGFSFTVADESYFIAFEFVEQSPVALGPGAPAGCKVRMAEPPKAEAEADLAEAMAASDLDPAMNGSSRAVFVACGI
jgi:ABC-type uncharacterized transport system substrate-binding protein